jgi:hypothetical protein
MECVLLLLYRQQVRVIGINWVPPVWWMVQEALPYFHNTQPRAKVN